MISKTLSPENQFRIVCPIFKAETKISACFQLRDLVWRGEGPPVRAGCQCAMAANKCPIPTAVTLMVRELNDPYHSAEPKVGKLSDQLLERIAITIIPERSMAAYALTAAEEKAILQSNEDARSGKNSAVKPVRRVERVMPMDDVPLVPAPAVSPAISKAAISGDLSAAISAEEAA